MLRGPSPRATGQEHPGSPSQVLPRPFPGAAQVLPRARPWKAASRPLLRPLPLGLESARGSSPEPLKPRRPRLGISLAQPLGETWNPRIPHLSQGLEAFS